MGTTASGHSGGPPQVVTTSLPAARGLMVRRTKAGRRAIGEAAPAHAETVQRCFFDQLSLDEIEAMAAVFDHVLENLRRESA